MNRQLRPRSTTAMVLSRADPRPGPIGAADSRPAPPRFERPRWLGVVKWTLLGAAIAALWVLLLLGDSLRPAAG